MASDEPLAGLYDYLYKDVDRLSSYAAQIFQGKLISREISATERNISENAGKLGIHNYVEGSVKHTGDTQESTKNVLDPHDVVTTDVLTYLKENERLASDVASASHGQLVLVDGTVTFIDRSMVRLVISSGSRMVAAEKQKPRAKRNGTMIDNYENAVAALNAVEIPSAFLLRTDDDLHVVGTIKDAGMQEPIATYYFKHGSSGLSQVYLIGIKEVPTLTPPLLFGVPPTLMEGTRELAQALSVLLFPQHAVRVSPLALFRRLI